MLPLTNINPGEDVYIDILSCSSEDAKRLRELGCVEGNRAVIISNHKNVILQVGDTRLALNNGLARSILVTPG